MGLNKTVDRESLHKAVARCVVTNDIYDDVAAENRNLMNRISGRPIDARDLGDLAMFLRYKPVFDDPQNGKELNEEEFKIECKNLIEAFANDDREKIFGYLDKWYDFVSGYNAPESIQTEAEALKYFVYLRAQQGLTVTKMEEYPEYVRSRFPDMDSMMSMQTVQQKIFIESNIAGYAFMKNDLEISVSSKREYDKDPKKYLEAFKVGRAMHIEANLASDEKKIDFTEAFFKATESGKPAPKDRASIRKFELPDWIKANKGKNPQEFSEEDLRTLNNCLRMSIGSNGSDYGVIHGYMRNKTVDLDAYRMVFIDGVSIYDSLLEPKTLNAAKIKFLDALCNQTGVVSIANVAEIDGKFEYRVNVLDVRDGNDVKEYSDKIEALEKSEDARKALFSAEASNLTDTLTVGKEAKINEVNEEAKEKAREVVEHKEMLLKAEYGIIDPSTVRKTRKEQYEEIEVNKKNVGAAFFMLDEVRTHYRRYHMESMKNKAILKARFSSSERIDERDFVDLMTFTRLAKTLGVGEKDLTEAEFAEETDKALVAWSIGDHAAMKPYLDKMYDFVTSYKMPNKIESVEDIMKSMMYLRVQQTVTVKLVENPWYVDMRCPTAMDKARFDAFKAEYYAIYNDIYDGTVKALGSEIGGREYTEILKQMRKPKQDRSEDDIIDSINMDLQSFKQSKYNAEVRKYLAEKRSRLANADKRPERSIYKIDLPDSAKALKGMDINAPEYEDEIVGFETGFTGVIYNLDLNDSKTLREYGYPSTGLFSDTSRLIYIDGESLYDIVVREQGVFKSNYAQKKMLHAMINQIGVVQFAHIYKEDDGNLNVELEILDVSSKGLNSLNNPQYIAKLADYEVSKAHYDAVKNKICTECIESKKVLDEARQQARKQAMEEGNAKYAEEVAHDEADFFNLDDVFDSVEYDVNGNIKERVKKDDSLNKLFKSERGKVMREQIAELSNFAHSDIVMHQLLGKINDVFSQEEINADAYNKLWKDVWLQTIDGLKGVAADDKYTKSVPFAEATEMVEKFMRGALKLYDHDAKEVKPFGGMTEEDMAKNLRAGVPSWEVLHYSNTLGRMNENQLSDFKNISRIEQRFKAWKKTSMEGYKNMTDVKAFDEYRNMDDTLNAQGKRYATATLIEFYDMINVVARNLVEDDMFNISADNLRADMYKFTADIKKAILEIGVVDEKGFEKVSGATLTLDSEIKKFGTDIEKLSEKNNDLEAEVSVDDIKNENSILSEDEILNENNISVENIVNENNISDNEINKENIIDTTSRQKQKDIESEYRGMREYEPEEESKDEENYRFDRDSTYNNIIGNDEDDNLNISKDTISNDGSAIDGVVIGDRKTNIAKAMRVDFITFMAGRYSVAKENPNSAYSVVTNGELRNLAVLFGGITSDNSQPNYIQLGDEASYDEITPDDVKVSDDFAAKYGIKLNSTDIESIIKSFIVENDNGSMEAVDKTMFEKEYKLLFGDLYMQTLHAANKLCCREGKTISAEQMYGAMCGLDKIMNDAAKKVGYPEKIVNGGITPDNFKKMQDYFADTFVPKNSSELALRTMQANSDRFNFVSPNWKEGLGFSAFTEMVSDEKENLISEPKTAESKSKAAQMYRAMTKYNGNRSWFSKFWNWRKNSREKRAIEQFKESAKNTLNIGDREFEELAATQPNADLTALKEGIERNRAKAEAGKNLKGLVSASSKDDISSSMQDDASEINSVIDSKSEDISMRERITVNEADHKISRKEDENKEKLKEAKAEKDKEKENDLKNRAPSA